MLDRPWAVLDSSQSFAVLECTLGDQWPWPGRARHRITLNDGGVAFELEIRSDSAPFPASAGWHPWVRRRYVVVFDELAEAVCVEPQTGPPDALTLEPFVVTPDHPLTTTMTWTWHPAG